MSTNTRNLKRFWIAKTNQILKCPHLSLSKKILAYKIFMRPLLIYNWFEGCKFELKSLEVHALKRIFFASREKCLYKRYTDLDVTEHLNLQAIQWNRATRSPFNILRQMLHAVSETVADPTLYFTRASDKRMYCRHRSYCSRHLTKSIYSDSSRKLDRRSRVIENVKRIYYKKCGYLQ